MKSAKASPRLETVIQLLARDSAVPEFEKNRDVIAHLATCWKVLQLYSGDPDPIHFHRNTAAFAEHICDRVGLPFEQLFPPLGAQQGFGTIGSRAVWRDPVWHFSDDYVGREKPGKSVARRAALNRFDVIARDLDIG